MGGNYARPEALVDVEWVRSHGRDEGVRLVEVDVDTELYRRGHIEGAVGWNWETDLNDPVQRDLIGRESFGELCSAAGIAADTTVVLYGDSNNWFACWALWQFRLNGHEDVRLMNGGRVKWEKEGLPLTTEVPSWPRASYRGRKADGSIRILRPEMETLVGAGGANLVDVRSPDEFTGRVIAPPGMMETALRAGHIPGALNVPWAMTVREDGTFKSREELQDLYADVDFGRPTVAYCRIGERSSHTWFVLKYLLGHEEVRNYDGSWTEWGNLVGAPIEREALTTAAV